MLFSNGISLCLFVVCYIENVATNEQPLSTGNNDFNITTDFTNISFAKRDYSPNIVHSGHDAVINPTPVTVNVINDFVADNRRNIKIKVNSTHDLLAKSQSKSVLATINQPLYDRVSVSEGSYLSRNTNKDLRLLNAPAISNDTRHPICMISDKYDRFIAVTYLCYSDQECKILFEEKSMCLAKPDSVRMDKCGCIPNYIYDGEKCVRQDSIYLCSTHRDCGVLKNSRCSCIMSTKVKLCRCPRNYVATKYECLPKVKYQSYCKDSIQCPGNMSCIGNICRFHCKSGYIWMNGCWEGRDDINYYNNDRSTFVSSLPYGIVITVCAIILFGSLFFFQKRFQQIRHSSLANNSNSRMENSRPTNIPPAISDGPPSYDDVITASTTTLIGAHNTAEDAPPNYDNCKEACYNKPDTPRYLCH